MDVRMIPRESFFVILALIASSIEPIMVKLGYQEGATTWQLLTYRNLFAATVVLALGGGLEKGYRWITTKDLVRVIPAALLLFCTNSLVIYALKSLSTLIVISMMTTTPAFVAVVNEWRGKVELGARFWFGFALSFLGVLLSLKVESLFRSSLSFQWLGLTALAIAVASSTVYRTKMDGLTKDIKPQRVTTYIFLCQATLVVFCFLPWIKPISFNILPFVAWTGTAAALANLAFISAIRVIGSTKMSLFDMLQRPGVVMASAFFLNEKVTWFQAIGFVFVLIGTYFAKVTNKNVLSSIAAENLPKTLLKERSI